MSENSSVVDPSAFVEMIMKWGSSNELNLTRSQTDALTRLQTIADIKFADYSEVAGISTRPIPLIVGPSGAGKSALVKEFAKRSNLPVFTVNISSWIPVGAKHDEYSLVALRKFIDSHSLGIIFIDELNKLRSKHTDSGSGWFMSVLIEVISLLEGDSTLQQSGFSEEHLARLKNFMIVGAGAWQEQWVNCRKRASMGFAGSAASETTDTGAFLAAIKNDDVIPQELLFRFNERLILLEPATEVEIAQRIAEIRDETIVGMNANPDDPEIRALACEAIRSGCPMRWLEAHASAALEECMADDVKNDAEERREELRKKSAQESYAKLYNSAHAIVKKLGYDTSLAAVDLMNCLNSENLAQIAPFSGFLSDIARAGRMFSLPTISDTARRNFFHKMETLSKVASPQFEELLKPDAVERLHATTYASVRKFLLLADQLRTECEVVNNILCDPASLVKAKVKDHADNRVEWF